MAGFKNGKPYKGEQEKVDTTEVTFDFSSYVWERSRFKSFFGHDTVRHMLVGSNDIIIDHIVGDIRYVYMVADAPAGYESDLESAIIKAEKVYGLRNTLFSSSGVRRPQSYGEMVAEFKRAFGCQIPFAGEGKEYADRIRMLQGLIKEEFVEYDTSFDIYNEIKEIADLVYVLIGYSHERHGERAFDKVFTEVHRSNISKLVDDGKPVLRDDGKILNGPNYSPADISKVLDECRNQEHTTGVR